MRGFVTCVCVIAVVLSVASATTAGPLKSFGKNSCADGKCGIDVPVAVEVKAPPKIKVTVPFAPAPKVSPAQAKPEQVNVVKEARRPAPKVRALLGKARILRR